MYNADFVFVLLVKIAGITGFQIFLELCYREGMILNWYYKSLDNRAEIARLVLRYYPKFYLSYLFIFITKPLGLCYLCQNFWLQLAFFNWYGVELAFLPCIIGISYIILLIYNKVIN